MVKTHNRIIAGALSTLLIGQVALFGDGTGKGLLHPDTIAYAADSIKAKKTEKELALIKSKNTVLLISKKLWR